MSRVPVATEVSAYVAARVAAFATEAPETLRWQLPFVEQFHALPLYIGWTETIALRPDGELVRWSTEAEYEGTRPVEDVLWVRSGLAEGAKRYPGLGSLIPARPAGALMCPACRGRGSLPALPQVICSCGGVGWVDSPGPGQ